MEYKITVNGLYNQLSTLFNDLALPRTKTYAELGIPSTYYISEDMVKEITFDGVDGAQNREALIYRICMDSLPFSVIYANPTVLQVAIKWWSLSKLPTWQALYDTLFYKYNPLWNKDAEHIERTNSNTDTKINRASTALDRTTYSSGIKERDTRFVNSYETGDTEVAFNPAIAVNNDIPYKSSKALSDAMTPTADTNNSPTGLTQNVTNNITTQGFKEMQNTFPASTGTSNLGWTHSNMNDVYHTTQSINSFDHAFTDNQNNQDAEYGTMNWQEHGNIGVMSTQELVQKSRELALFNIFDIIVTDFIKQFCIMVY